jgi:hypothetical protein
MLNSLTAKLAGVLAVLVIFGAAITSAAGALIIPINPCIFGPHIQTTPPAGQTSVVAGGNGKFGVAEVFPPKSAGVTNYDVQAVNGASYELSNQLVFPELRLLT